VETASNLTGSASYNVQHYKRKHAEYQFCALRHGGGEE
jgi:hypothetical protein